MKDISVSPEVHFLEEVLKWIAAGELRVPKFQRPFLWRPEQMLQLFDSMERGYPMGSLLIWETTEELASLDTIGGLPIPDPPDRSKVSYVLDGHQRLSTFFGSLHRPADAPRSERQEDWMWWVYRPLRREEQEPSRYRHHKSEDRAEPDYLPIRSVLRTVDFLGYSRGLYDTYPEDVADRLVEEAELVAQRIKSYKVSVVRMSGGTLGQAVEVFSRINSSGQKVRPDQMVSALTYETTGELTLSDRMEEIQARISDFGFGEIPMMTIFQTVLAVFGEEDVQNTSWDIVARKVRGKLLGAVGDTDRVLEQVVTFLRDTVRVPLARLVPYNIQIMLLAVFFHFAPEAGEEQAEKLRKWFWTTSLAGTFAGANTTQVRKFIEEMKAFAAGTGRLDYSQERARAFPERFDLRSARVRSYLIWELAAFPDRINPDGSPIAPIEQLARSHIGTYRHVVTQSGVYGLSSPANRVVMKTPPGLSIRQALIDLAAEDRTDVLDSHGVSLEAVERLKENDYTGFIKTRQHEIATRERVFIEDMGILPPEQEAGEADIDTE